MQPMKPMGGKGKPMGKAGSKGKGAAAKCKKCGQPMTKGHKC